MVVLKKGRLRVHHFAHKPPTDCHLATGETPAHLAAKEAFRRHFVARGYATDVEVPLTGGAAHLRADVLTRPRPGLTAAVELQHTVIEPDEVAARTRAYLALGIAVASIPLLRPARLDAHPAGDGLVVERYAARPFARWLHGLGLGELWYFDPAAAVLWQGRLDAAFIEVKESEWHDPQLGTVYGGACARHSRRWRRLSLTGPYRLDEVTFRPVRRRPVRLGPRAWPGGVIIRIEPAPGTAAGPTSATGCRPAAG